MVLLSLDSPLMGDDNGVDDDRALLLRRGDGVWNCAASRDSAVSRRGVMRIGGGVAPGELRRPDELFLGELRRPDELFLGELRRPDERGELTVGDGVYGVESGDASAVGVGVGVLRGRRRLVHRPR